MCPDGCNVLSTVTNADCSKFLVILAAFIRILAGVSQAAYCLTAKTVRLNESLLYMYEVRLLQAALPIHPLVFISRLEFPGCSKTPIRQPRARFKLSES